MTSKAWQAGARLVHDVAEALTPVLKDSGLQDRGVLTPEEFVRAGDNLVYRCPTWAWCAGDVRYRKAYLPADKQYLITRNVPCSQRVRDLDRSCLSDKTVVLDGAAGEGLGDDNTWVAAEVTGGTKQMQTQEFVELDDDLTAEGGEGVVAGGGKVEASGVVAAAAGSAAPVSRLGVDTGGLLIRGMGTGNGAASGIGKAAAGSEGNDDDDDDDDYVDLEGFEEDDLEGDDGFVFAGGDDDKKPSSASSSSSAGAAAMAETSAVILTRRYDLSITYDKYYQVPRVWLFGYDEERAPLTPDAIFEDIVQDYAQRTVTVEAHPHEDASSVYASIHPCQHANAMKKIIEALSGGEDRARGGDGTGFAGTGRGSKSGLDVENYLFVFLKFIQSVVPTINYDFTMSVKAKS